MKRFGTLLLASALLLTGCGTDIPVTQQESSSAETTTEPDFMAALANDGYDIDLTTLGSNMMYGQVFDMMNDPDKYMDKTVRVTGNFNYYQDPAGKQYFAVFIPDAAACCAQGMEFILADTSAVYPDDYPEDGELITVTGNFSYYTEYTLNYCQLLDAQIIPTVPRKEDTTNESE